MKAFRVFAAFAAAAFLAVVSCTPSVPAPTDPEAVSEWVKSFPSPKVRSGAPVKVEFWQGIISDSLRTLPASEVFSVVPSVPGEYVWGESGCSIEFVPAPGALKPGTGYAGIVKMEAVAGVPGSPDFVFAFTPLAKSCSVEDGLCRVDPADPSRAVFSATVSFSEAPGDGAVTADMFSIRGTGASDAVITVSGSGCGYALQVSGLERQDSDAKASLTFDPSSAGFGDRNAIVFDIPGRQRFRVLDARKTGGADPCIEVLFSEPLDASQSVDGLVYLDEIWPVTLHRSGSCVKMYYDDNGSNKLTVHVDGALRAADGRIIGNDVTTTLFAQSIPPAVEMMLDGNILPDRACLDLPFRAVNLAAVDVTVYQVFEDNVPMFFQDNDLGGDDCLRRSARPIYRETARLDLDPTVNLHAWHSFSVDLSGLFKQQRGAVYKVLLSFKKEYSLFDREASDIDPSVFKSELSDEYMAAWDEPYPYYYDDIGMDWSVYNWNERNDPAAQSYYMVSDRFPSVNVMATNLGIICKSADNGTLWVTVSDIVSSKPESGVQVTAYNFQLQEVGRGITDGNGFTDFAVASKPFLVKAFKGETETFLKVTDGKEKSLSRFDVGGKTLDKGLKGFIYGERGIWRPGDTMHLTLVVEDKAGRLPEDHPVTLEVYTPQGQFFDKQVRKGGTDGFYTFDLATSEDSPTGSWTAVFTVGGARFTKSLPVETIKPNRLKINLKLDDKMLSCGTEEHVSVESSWLSGPPASDLEGSLSVIVRRLPEPFPGYAGYEFNSPLQEFSKQEISLASFRLDSTGVCSGSVDIPEMSEAPGMLSGTVVCTVAEPGGDQSMVSTKTVISPYDAYVGIDLGDGNFETDKDLSFPVAVLGPDGKAIDGRSLEYGIYRLKWSWWWESTPSDLASYIQGSNVTLVASGTLRTAAGKASVPFRAESSAWGKYLVVVSDSAGGHETGGVVFIDQPAWMGRTAGDDPDAINILSFTLDKDSYEVGETASIYIPAASGGHALVSVENSTGVISRRWAATSAEGQTVCKLEVTPEMSPDFFVHVTLLQPYGNTANDLPLRMYGVKAVTVTDRKSRLEPVITVPGTVRPQERFTVKVNERSGRPMTYTLAVVDEGLLDISGYTTPDLWSAMNEREALGVRTWDMYDNVAGAFAGRFSSVLSIGGGDYAAYDSERKENRFNPVVEFLGPFTLAKGAASHDITLPMYVGKVKVMVVAGHDGAYGSADRDVTVRSPLMVMPTLPRRLSCGEEVSLPVNVFAMEKGMGDVTVTVEADGPVSIEGKSSAKLHFAAEGDCITAFRLRTDAAAEGVAHVRVKAVGGGETTHDEIAVEVSNANVPVTDKRSDVLAPGKSGNVSWEAFKASSAEGVSMTVTPFPSIDFTRTFEFVRCYDHLCTEQLASRAFNMLYARKFINPANAAKAEALLEEIIPDLCARQLPDGGFCYWPGGRYANAWATSMAGQALFEARRQGFKVAGSVIDSWLAYQRKAVKAYSASGRYDMSDLQQAYRLYTMALAGSPDTGAMNRLREAKGVSAPARWRLAAAYAVQGKKSVAGQITGDVSLVVKAPADDATFWSRLRDRSMMLETLVLEGRTAEALELAAQVASEYDATEPSTQEVAFTSLALSRLADVTGTSGARIEYGQGAGAGTLVADGAVAAVALDSGAGNLSFTNLSDGPAYVNVSITRRPAACGKVQASSHGCKVTVTYTDRNGKVLDVSSIPQGTEFYAQISVDALPGMPSSSNMALSFTTPSGWEIWNSRLFGGDDGGDGYTDIRDTKVQWYFPLKSGGHKDFELALRAAYSGRFLLPSTVCEDMYNTACRSVTAGSTVEVR